MADPVLTNSASGTGNTATTTANFGFTATAGRLLLLTAITDAYDTGTPSGWEVPPNGAVEINHGHYVWYRFAQGGETSVQYSIGGDFNSAWWVGEVSNIYQGDPIDVTEQNGFNSGSLLIASDPVTPTGGPRFSMVFMGAGGTNGFNSAVGDWTNSYTELADFRNSPVSGTQHVGGVAALIHTGDGSTSTSTQVTFTPSSAAHRSTISITWKVLDLSSGWTWANAVRMG